MCVVCVVCVCVYSGYDHMIYLLCAIYRSGLIIVPCNMITIITLIIIFNYSYRDYEDDVLDNPFQQRHRLIFCTVFMGWVMTYM